MYFVSFPSRAPLEVVVLVTIPWLYCVYSVRFYYHIRQLLHLTCNKNEEKKHIKLNSRSNLTKALGIIGKQKHGVIRLEWNLSSARYVCVVGGKFKFMNLFRTFQFNDLFLFIYFFNRHSIKIFINKITYSHSKYSLFRIFKCFLYDNHSASK